MYLFQKSLAIFGLLFLTSAVSLCQSITVSSPNGGEVLYSCQQYNVTWTQSGSPSNYWNIDYSLDGGTIWTSVASNYLSVNGTFLWTVPNVQSTTVLMRVFDANNPGTVDQSNNYFTINIPIVLTAPNGGESWQGNTVHNITWNMIGTSNTFNLAYSLNNGSSWTNIVTNYSTGTGSYAWTVPSVNVSNQCLVRVRDAVTSCMEDISNSVFTITPPTPQVTYPNGGELLYANCPFVITWNQASYFSNVQIEYSLNGGASFIVITSNTSNDGSYSWTPPSTPDNEVRIRVCNVENLSINDVSNANFSLLPTILIISPNGGEAWTTCSTYNVVIELAPCVSSVGIQYSTDNGVSWSGATVTLISSSGNQRTYAWAVPYTIGNAAVLIKAYDAFNSTIFDVTDAAISISANSDIVVLTPNGGESLVAASNYNITWSNTSQVSGIYNIQFSLNNGSSWSTVVNGVTGNSYNWTVNNAVSSQCLIRVLDANNNCYRDQSNASFSITGLVTTVLYPNGGESFYAGCSAVINWNSATYYNNVRIDYSSDNGTTWTNITTSTSNDGAYTWSIPSIVGTNFLIKVSQIDNLAVNDVSDAVFTILPHITVVSPNGGETWTTCTTQQVVLNFDATCFSSVVIQYSENNGVNWTSPGFTFVGANGNDRTYSWVVPYTITSSSILIRAYDTFTSSYVDISDAPINIVPNTVLDITSPDGGEIFAPFSQQTITWTNTSEASGVYNLYYSTNGGSSYSTIATNVIGNSYNWTVANAPSTECVIRIIDDVNTCLRNVSDGEFTITPQSPVMTEPNGGESFYAGCSAVINWNSATYYNNVRIDYSSDNGLTWTNITTSTSNDGAYTWSIPSIVGTNYLIRVSQIDNLAVNDVSDAVFTILPHITVVSPNGGETWTTCTTQQVVLNFDATCFSSVVIQYSENNGVNWTSPGFTFVGANGNDRTYSWVVPYTITSSSILIRAYDTFTSSYVDISDAPINIVPNTVLDITSPDGGEIFAPFSQQTITWTNTSEASGVYNLYYSTDGGSSYSTIATNVIGNSYNWTVANAPSTECVIRIIDDVNTCLRNVSDGEFTITPQSPVMTEPNGGESFYAGCSAVINWNSATYYNNVRIDYSSDNGLTWTNITTSTSNDGAYTWSIPSIVGTNYLIRVSQIDNLAVNDVSDAVFTILPHITVVSPNGGETWTTCTTQQVVLNFDATCFSSVVIQYSENNGVNWTSPGFTFVGANGNDRTYSWVVPYTITSSSILIRAYDTFTSSYVDISDAPINIVPNTVLDITSPDGGEIFAPFSQQTITWTNTSEASGVYNLYYSTNGGSSYSTIATNVIGNSYNWTVANAPSTECVIRIIDDVNTCLRNVSDGEFTITPQSPVMTEPNGGESFYAGCSAVINWNSATYYNNVRIDYSSDNGLTWTNITTSTSNDGAYTWSIPSIVGTNYLIRVSQIDNLAVNDVSDAVFTILPHITVVSPNGGETWTTCTTQQVVLNFDATCFSSVVIQYSENNGVNWTSPGFTFVGANGNDRTYSWVVPYTITSPSILIRAYDTFTSSYVDISDAPINIVPNTVLDITSPDGGEIFAPFSQQTITWTNTSEASGVYNLYYSTNGGSSYSTIASNVIGNSYNWTVANAPSTECVIRIIDDVNTCLRNVSDGEFTITPQSPLLTAPNWGETMYSQDTEIITWNSSTFYNTVRLEYSTDAGLTWTTITTSTTNDGSYTWTVPQADSDECLVRVSQTDNLNQSDVSDAFFTIRPAVTIITPNGDNGVTIWGGCTVTSITFDHTPAYSTWKLEYSVNNGASWTVITNSWSATVNPATYNWTMPNIPTSQALVRVAPTSSLNYADVSDDTFTITKPVTIIQPNFGGIMQVGSTFNIQWTSDGISNLYDIFYSTDGGTNFTNIVTGYNTSNNTYPWLVPNIPSSNCRIWVRDNINYCKADTSDIAFAISTTAPPLTITTPNGIADTLTGCSAFNISWTETSDIATYDIAYSLNSGASWTDIVTNYNAPTNSYDWTVPNNINSSNVLIRVRSSVQPTTYDLTDAFISVFSGELIATPEFASECSNVPIQLSATGGSNYSWSPSSGLDNPNIANPIAIPLSTTTYTVVSDVGGCILSDEVTIEVSQSGLPAIIDIFHDQADVICEGTNVTFTAEIESGGSNPQYQWQVNGEDVGSNLPQYSANDLTAEDIITCILTSDLACVSNNPATSNVLQLDIQDNVTPAISIISSTGNTICDGQDVVFTAVPVNGGDSPSFSWTLNGNPVGTNSISLEGLTLSDSDNIGLSMISNATCLTAANASAPFITMNVGSIPSSPASIMGNSALCVGETSMYSINAVDGATSYEWSVPSGWSFSDMGTMINVVTGSIAGDISVVASNGCGESEATVLNVAVESAPEFSGTISGPSSVCFGTVADYFVEAVDNAVSYDWTLPEDWSGSSSTSNMTIDFGDSGSDGELTVVAWNACGASTPLSLTIDVGSPASLPSVISGNISPCADESVVYSIDEYFGAESYVWTLPIGWTGSSSSNSIEVTSGMMGGEISVYAITPCGNSPTRTLVLDIQDIPMMTGAIGGQSIVCVGGSYDYNIASAINADAYVWTFPSGWTYSGNTNVVNATAGDNNGLIEVYAMNECGSTENAAFVVTTQNAPSAPSDISGSVSLCEDEETSYSIDAVAGADGYNWILPAGWSGTSNSTSITATASATNGSIMVSAYNACGTSATISLAVEITPLPQLENTIQGDILVCSGSSANYAVGTNSLATEYTWTLPAGWSGMSFTESIAAVAGANSGVISVTASNACGSGNAVLLNVEVQNPPVLSEITGSESLCVGDDQLFSAIAEGATDDVVWTIPSGWSSIGSGLAIQVSDVDVSGELEVYALNECGVSNTLTKLVIVHELPNVSITALPDAVLCEGESVSLFGNGASSYTWNLGVADGVAFSPAGSGSYQVTGTDANNCSNSSTISLVVNDLPNVQLVLTGEEIQCIETVSVPLGGGTPVGGTYSGDGVIGSSFYPEQAGLGVAAIQYSYTDANGCSADADDAFVVEICDHVAELKNPGITTYPNPASEVIHVSIDQHVIAGLYVLDLYDEMGKWIRSWKSSQPTLVLDVSDLSNGIYSLRLHQTENTCVVPVVIAK